MKGLGIVFRKKRTLSFNFHKIPEIKPDEPELAPLFLSRIFCFACSVYCACVTSRARVVSCLVKRPGQRLSPPPHTRRSNADL